MTKKQRISEEAAKRANHALVASEQFTSGAVDSLADVDVVQALVEQADAATENQ
jgi:hypothetical protein